MNWLILFRLGGLISYRSLLRQETGSTVFVYLLKKSHGSNFNESRCEEVRIHYTLNLRDLFWNITRWNTEYG